jgi:hypothetical protein
MTFMMTGARWAAIVAAVALTVPSSAAAAYADVEASAPPSEKITLDVQTVNGSGCPLGTASVAMLSDNTGFKITYAAFRAEDGGNAGVTDFRKNCQVNLLVNIPQGFTFAVDRADYWGKAHLESGATALERSNYYYQGSSENNYVDHTFRGPLDGTWRATDITQTADLVYAPCGAVRGLNINTELRVNSGTSTAKSYITLRASDGEVYTLVQFHWKHC